MSPFREYKGNRCPIAEDKMVIVRFRGGFTAKEPLAAGKYRWKQWPEGPHAFDIVAYSVMGEKADQGGTWTAVSGGYS